MFPLNSTERVLTTERAEHLVFIHIPKTAGTFIRTGLEQHYGKIGCIYPSPPFTSFKSMEKAQLDAVQKTRVLIGHESIHSFERHLTNPARYFTILRNPVDRLISYYNHAMTNFPKYKNQKITPMKFLQNASNHETDNLQLRYLSGKPVTERVGEQDLEYAKNLIDSGKVTVGIKEFLQESLNSMSLFDGVQFDQNRPINSSTFGFSRDSLTEDEIQSLRNRSYWDVKLYQYALTIFETRKRKS